MKAVLDSCVLFPTVPREMLIGAARAGGFTPVWSVRILDEWALAARKLPDGAEAVARAEIALLRRDWPQAEVAPEASLVEMLSLPDPNDRHVLAAAIECDAGALVTRNRRDFPNRTLARHGVLLLDPDRFLLDMHTAGVGIAEVAEEVRRRAERASGREQALRPLLKRAGLPRLSKALDPEYR